MTEVLRSLPPSDQAGPQAAEELLPLLYKELRQLAARKLAHELPGQTLQATDLVHEVYVRLVGGENPHRFDSSGHFFAAAAEAMRRILVERARKKAALKRGGKAVRLDLDQVAPMGEDKSYELLALDEALDGLAEHDSQAARLVELRYFAGLTHQQAAKVLGISRRTADRLWMLAKAWLYQRLGERES
jgi:RNA polymerase sigma factor (TIGR02999 family)